MTHNACKQFTVAPAPSLITTWFIITIIFDITRLLLRVLLLLVMFGIGKNRKFSGFFVMCLQIVEINFIDITSPLHNITFIAARLNIRLAQINCDILLLFNATLIAVSLWLGVYLAVSRFTAIVIPRRYRFVTTKPVVGAFALAPWTIALSITLPLHYVSEPSVGVACGVVPIFRGVPSRMLGVI